MALSQQQFCVRWNSYHMNLQTVFPKLLSTENFADVTLACENRQLRCHKVVLSACSAYFERLLVQNPCKHPIIFMKDMRFSEMQSLVDFMYKGEVNVTQEDLPSLLKSAEALQIRGLCSESNGLTGAVPPSTATGTMPATIPAGAGSSPAAGGKDYTVASHALLAQLQAGAAAVQCEGLGQVQVGAGEGSAVIPPVSAPPTTLSTPMTSSLAVQGVSGSALGKKRRSPSENHHPPTRLSPSQQGNGDEAIVGAGGKTPRRSGNLSVDVKEETVEEDGLYYGELENEDLDYNEQDEEGAMPGGSIGAPASGRHLNSASYIRVKPENKLLMPVRSAGKAKNIKYNKNRLSMMNAFEIQAEFAKFGFTTSLQSFGSNEDVTQQKQMNEKKVEHKIISDDYLKLWLEQNDELEVSLSSAKTESKTNVKNVNNVTKYSPINKTTSLLEKTLTNKHSKIDGIHSAQQFSQGHLIEYKNVTLPHATFKSTMLPQYRKYPKKGRPPLFGKDRYLDLGDSIFKADLEQFLEGKEVSSSGLSRKDLERVMMGKFNPNRRYSNEAMWAALMDVKKGGSIYRAAQTHKVPRKSLRNWMKRCHIKSSFPMPQQLKQFVENNRKQKEDAFKGFTNSTCDFDMATPEFSVRGKTSTETELHGDSGISLLNYSQYECDFDIGKHFLSIASSNTVSSEEEISLSVLANAKSDDVHNGDVKDAYVENECSNLMDDSVKQTSDTTIDFIDVNKLGAE